MQALIDQYASIAPIKIIGDLNTQLPQSLKLQKNWHKQGNFNAYSNILYNFLVFNDFVVADMLHKQNVEYTYFCHKNKTYTWIDHIICDHHDASNITSCAIIPEESSNNSDHLPVQLIFSLAIKELNPKKYLFLISYSLLIQICGL